MSEVHKHEQGAVSPSFIPDLTETTQELGTSLSSSLVFLLLVVFVFPRSCVCCVWREKKESGVCTWELWKTFLYLTQV